MTIRDHVRDYSTDAPRPASASVDEAERSRYRARVWCILLRALAFVLIALVVLAVLDGYLTGYDVPTAAALADSGEERGC